MIIVKIIAIYKKDHDGYRPRNPIHSLEGF